MKVIQCVLWGMVAVFASGVNAAGDAAAGKSKSATCLACHGADGNSPLAMYPKIAGQPENYLAAQIKAFRDKGRQDPLMTPMATSLSDQDIEDLAAYYATQAMGHGAAPPDSVALGEKIYRGGNQKTKVPACMSCHGPNGAGNGPAGWPALAGQHPDYTGKQLRDFANAQRPGGPNDMMSDLASRLSEEEIKAVSGYLAGLH